MKKQHVEFIEDSFVDFEGNERKFTLCALSQLDEDSTICMAGYDDYYNIEVVKTLSIGYAVCSAQDTFKPELGKIIARGRAEVAEPLMFVTDPGVINHKMVKALLEQEAEYFKMNPDHYIDGYARAKAKHAK